MSFTVASYNVLANAYVHYGLYRRTPKMVLDPLWRMPAVVYQVASIGADVLCLQEVEVGTFAALKHRLKSLGYVGAARAQAGGKPDGCAIFYREAAFELVATRVIEYADGAEGQANSGHIALIVFATGRGPCYRHCQHTSHLGPTRHPDGRKAGPSTSAAVAERMPEHSAIPPRMAHLRRSQRNSGQ